MVGRDLGSGVRAELYVREELPYPADERVGAVAGRLDAMAAEGAVDDVERHEWVKRVPVDGCDCDLRDTYLAFRAWADDAGVRLTPFFQTRECYTPSAEDYTDWLVTPAMCLAVYEDGDLTSVYPHAVGEETASVEDGLEALGDADAEPGEDGGKRAVVGD